MADCGASGTALDRAARALLQGPSQDQSSITKHVGNLLHHVSVVPQQGGGPLQTSVMPTASPNHLLLPGTSTGPTVRVNDRVTPTLLPQPTHVAIRHPSSMDAVWQAETPPHAHLHGPPQVQFMQQHHQHHHHLSSVIHHQQQQQYAMQAMLQQEHQHLMMQQLQLQQQRNISNAQKHQQDLRSQETVTAINAKDDRVESSEAFGLEENVGHEGIVKGASIEELATAWAEAIGEGDEEVALGHEGIVEGASAEDLRAAWAQAEAEYEAIADSEDGANLWSGDTSPVEMAPYEFVHKDVPTEMLDWMSEGMRYFQEGNLRKSIHSFEMELQHGNPNNSMAWRMLGRCHAENDQDPEAIKCLEAAVDRDPFSPESLLALGVSYVNELNHERALANLKAWLTHNPKFADMEMPGDILGTKEVAGDSAFEEVKQMLLSALNFDSTDAGDIYEALGVVYNVNKDYEAAADAFRKAIDARPNDYQLWNKLGATLANGSQSEQALPNYHKALQIKPKYARAWLNMAISHSNLQSLDEASRCYLQTLSLNPAAEHCWTYLRMSLSCAERWDLLPLVFSRELRAFQEHFDFVTYDS